MATDPTALDEDTCEAREYACCEGRMTPPDSCPRGELMDILDQLPSTVHVIETGFVAPGVLRVTTLSEAHARLAAGSLMQAGWDVARSGATVTVVEAEENR